VSDCEIKDLCKPSLNKMFASVQRFEVETLATVIFSKQRFLLFEGEIVSGNCGIEETVVTAVFDVTEFWLVLSEVEGDTAVCSVCDYIELVLLSVSVQRLVWCLRLQLRQWFLL